LFTLYSAKIHIFLVTTKYSSSEWIKNCPLDFSPLDFYCKWEVEHFILLKSNQKKPQDFHKDLGLYRTRVN
jgi:hypothetical protein